MHSTKWDLEEFGDYLLVRGQKAIIFDAVDMWNLVYQCICDNDLDGNRTRSRKHIDIFALTIDPDDSSGICGSKNVGSATNSFCQLWEEPLKVVF